MILFDIDDTIAYTKDRWFEVTDAFMERMGHRCTGDIGNPYAVEDYYDINADELDNYHIYMDYAFPYEKLDHIPGSDVVIKKLLTKHYAVGFITNRPSSLDKINKAWLREHIAEDVDFPIWYTREKPLATILKEVPCELLIDNNASRCVLAKNMNTPSILFCGVGVDMSSASPAAVFSIPKVNTYKELYKAIGDVLLKSEVANKKSSTENEINIGDYVKITNDFVFKMTKNKVPETLKDKPLKVIDLYKDPAKKNLVRVSVTCEGVPNPKSKYNCFYISGKFIEKIKKPEEKKTLTGNLTLAPREFINTIAHITPAYDHYIVRYISKGVVRIIPVTKDTSIPNPSTEWKILRDQDGNMYYAEWEQVFDNINDILNYIEKEF